MPSRPGVLSYQDLTGHLDRGSISTVYLLTGEEEFLIQAAMERLVGAVVDSRTKDFNHTVLDGETASADEILTAVESLPAFAERRLVVLKSAEQLPAGEANRLVPYLNNPSPSTCFVCIAPKFDARRSFFQALKMHGAVVDCRPLTDAQVTVWLKARAKSLGSTLSEDAVIFLKERVGRDLFPLQNELTKAVLGSDQPKTIGLEDVQRACSVSGEVSVYDLLNALSQRRIEPSIRTLTRLVDEGEPPLKILSTISYRFRLVWKVKQAMHAGHTDAALMRMFGLGQWAGSVAIAAAKAYPEKDLRFAFQRFVETDAGLKGGLLSPKLLLEILVLDLCSGKQKGLRRFLGRQPLLYL
jgi:DNA polymerase III subunit delta